MKEEISFEHDGVTYFCTYYLEWDELTVCLPDFSQRANFLLSLDAESAT